jgi:MFS family permease
VPGNEAWFIAVAVLFGVANGVSSGVILTVGADLAPKRHPAAFLGAYRTIGDAGQAAAPLVVSAVTSLVSLAAASAAIGVLGFVGAGMLLRWIPRYVPGRRGRRRGEGEGPAEGTG